MTPITTCGSFDTIEPHRYLLDEIFADVNAGHNVVSTVFIECRAMYRPDGPQELRAVGEIEFVNRIAAVSASGLYGPCRIAAGVVGAADLTFGNAVEVVRDAQISASAIKPAGMPARTCQSHAIAATALVS